MTPCKFVLVPFRATRVTGERNPRAGRRGRGAGGGQPGVPGRARRPGFLDDQLVGYGVVSFELPRAQARAPIACPPPPPASFGLSSPSRGVPSGRRVAAARAARCRVQVRQASDIVLFEFATRAPLLSIVYGIAASSSSILSEVGPRGAGLGAECAVVHQRRTRTSSSRCRPTTSSARAAGDFPAGGGARSSAAAAAPAPTKPPSACADGPTAARCGARGGAARAAGGRGAGARARRASARVARSGRAARGPACGPSARASAARARLRWCCRSARGVCT